MAKVVTPFTSRTQPLALLIEQFSADQPVKSNETLTVGDDGKKTVTMGSIIEILWPSDTLGDAAVPLHQKIQRVLVKATEQAKAGSATGAVLKQFEGNMSRLPNVQSVYSSRKLALYGKGMLRGIFLFSLQAKLQPVLCSALGRSSGDMVLRGRLPTLRV